MSRFHTIGSRDPKTGKLVQKKIPFTAAEETARDAEEAQGAQERADYKYKHDRRAAYGPVEDQLDMIYWDQVNGTTTWRDHIAAVRAAHPKPA